MAIRTRITARCNECEACVEVCPTESIFAGRGRYAIDSDTCTECQICVEVCPENAIEPGAIEE